MNGKNHEKKTINQSTIELAHKDIPSVDKANVDEVDWKLSLQQVIAGIESGRLSLYIYTGGSNKEKVIVSESTNGKKILKTEHE